MTNAEGHRLVVNNKGQITVFMCLLILSLLLTGLTALEVIHISNEKARSAEAVNGAVTSIKADYNRTLFDDYHLLLLDKNYYGYGEGGLEEQMKDYLEYTLNQAGMSEEYDVEQVALSDYAGVLDNDCEALKSQITEYMKIYSEVFVVQNLTDMIINGGDVSETAEDAVNTGQNEENTEESDWEGEDPRDAVEDVTSVGLLSLVVPDGISPSKDEIDLSGMPSKNINENDEDVEDDFSFDDMEELSNLLGTSNSDCIMALQENIYGIAYVMECFDYFTCDNDYDNELECEVEYIIAGKDNDYDNLQSVVNRIMLHRIGFNFVSLLGDNTRIAEVESIALVIALLPGITYGVAKYLLLGCWAYAETVVEIKSLLAGNSIPYIKTPESWLTDINNLGNIANISDSGYEGTDGIDYKGFLMIFLAEKADVMYYRLADVIQLNMRAENDKFLLEDYICAFRVDFKIRGTPLYLDFMTETSGFEKGEGDKYTYYFEKDVGY